MGFPRFLIFLSLSIFTSASFSQSYPSKPVHVIISFTPGSSTDSVGRIVMAKVAEYWGQPVVPENRGGVGGSIGSAGRAQAPPPGDQPLVNIPAPPGHPPTYAHT